MTIHSIDGHVNALWDWAIIEDAFAGRVRPSDWDGVVERGGYFLQLEGKPGDKPLANAEVWKFQGRVRSGVDTVVVIWGNAPTGEVTAMKVWYPDGTVSHREKCTTGDLFELCRCWDLMARTCSKSARDFVTSIKERFPVAA